MFSRRHTLIYLIYFHWIPSTSLTAISCTHAHAHTFSSRTLELSLEKVKLQKLEGCGKVSFLGFILGCFQNYAAEALLIRDCRFVLYQSYAHEFVPAWTGETMHQPLQIMWTTEGQMALFFAHNPAQPSNPSFLNSFVSQLCMFITDTSEPEGSLHVHLAMANLTETSA